jgi:hypothetical protein
MALSASVLSDLLDAFRAGEGVDLIRDAVQGPPSVGFDVPVGGRDRDDGVRPPSKLRTGVDSLPEREL